MIKQNVSVQCTSEFLHRGADLAHAHIGVSHDGEVVELSTAQVQEGTAGLVGATGGINP